MVSFRKEYWVNYDLYPKVVIEGDPVTVTIRPLGRHAAFNPDFEYHMVVQPRGARRGDTDDSLDATFKTEFSLKPDADGCLRFPFTFKGEGAWFIRFFEPEAEKNLAYVVLYSLHEDMRGRYPFLGDLHVHSCVSDGHQAPGIVMASLRQRGYDFSVLSDHRRYYGSLEAMRAFDGVPIDLNIIPGEECHMPDILAHIVNFGGKWSVNSLIDTCVAYEERGTDPKYHSLEGACPPAISLEEYRRQVKEIADKLPQLPPDVEPLAYAACLWTFDRIRDAGGLAILAHPYWIYRHAFNLGEPLIEHLLREHPFDAFELFGGSKNPEMDEMQTYKYMELRADGVHFPVVGSSDSHNCTDLNPFRSVGQTIVFAKENERQALIDAIRESYSVAVENNSKEFRLGGDFRFVCFGRFLLDEFFPHQAELYYEEGRLMREHVLGDPDAGRQLAALHGRWRKLREKYFAN